MREQSILECLHAHMLLQDSYISRHMFDAISSMLITELDAHLVANDMKILTALEIERVTLA